MNPPEFMTLIDCCAGVGVLVGVAVGVLVGVGVGVLVGGTGVFVGVGVGVLVGGTAVSVGVGLVYWLVAPAYLSASQFLLASWLAAASAYTPACDDRDRLQSLLRRRVVRSASGSGCSAARHGLGGPIDSSSHWRDACASPMNNAAGDGKTADSINSSTVAPTTVAPIYGVRFTFW